MPHSAYRHIAAVSGLLLFFWGLDFFIWGDMYDYGETQIRMRETMHALWHTCLCVAMAYGWLAESRWRTNTRLNVLLTPLLHGMYYTLLANMLISLLTGVPGGEFRMFEAARGMVGIGAGVGLIYCAHALTQIAETPFLRRLFLGFALLALAGGWFLPGISVGLLGLTLGRHRGDVVALGVTGVALAVYFFCYYYNLDTTLLDKSITLMQSGAILCLAAFCIYKAGDRA